MSGNIFQSAFYTATYDYSVSDNTFLLLRLDNTPVGPFRATPNF